VQLTLRATIVELDKITEIKKLITKRFLENLFISGIQEKSLKFSKESAPSRNNHGKIRKLDVNEASLLLAGLSSLAL